MHCAFYAAKGREMDFDSLLKAHQEEAASSSKQEEQVAKRPRAFRPPLVRCKKTRDYRPLKVLTIVCAGPNSLHPHWTAQDEEEVSFLVMWYGKEPPSKRFTEKTMKVIEMQGTKWVLIRHALKEVDWNAYDYVFLPDDDIDFTIGTISDLAHVMDEYNLYLAQPCLVDLNITCAGYRHVLVKSNYHQALFHRTNCRFVLI